LTVVTTTTTTESDVRRFLRGILILVAIGLIILPAYINYELYARLHFNPIATIAISLQLFAIGIVILIVAIGPTMFQRRPPQ
jgi:hypothetical protein